MSVDIDDVFKLIPSKFLTQLKNLLHGRAKTGIALSNKGLERSYLLEIFQFPYGLSFDVGGTKSQLFAGVSKDFFTSGNITFDFGVGYTTEKSITAGINVNF